VVLSGVGKESAEKHGVVEIIIKKSYRLWLKKNRSKK